MDHLVFLLYTATLFGTILTTFFYSLRNIRSRLPAFGAGTLFALIYAGNNRSLHYTNYNNAMQKASDQGIDLYHFYLSNTLSVNWSIFFLFVAFVIAILIVLNIYKLLNEVVRSAFVILISYGTLSVIILTFSANMHASSYFSLTSGVLIGSLLYITFHYALKDSEITGSMDYFKRKRY